VQRNGRSVLIGGEGGICDWCSTKELTGKWVGTVRKEGHAPDITDGEVVGAVGENNVLQVLSLILDGFVDFLDTKAELIHSLVEDTARAL
jgi:hypothetical protein